MNIIVKFYIVKGHVDSENEYKWIVKKKDFVLEKCTI